MPPKIPINSLTGFVLFFSMSSSGATPYELLDLGTLGGSITIGYSLNDNREVTGYSKTAVGETRAIRYANGSILDLGTLGGMHSYGFDINENGLVSGRAQTLSGDFRAFIYDGSVQDLGTLGGSQSKAFSINELGHATGVAHVPGDIDHAFYFDGTTMFDIGTLNGETSTGQRINNSGEITGYYVNADGYTQAFYYDGVSMHDIGTLGGSTSTGADINSSGVITGTAENADGHQRAFLFDGLMSELGTLGGDFSTSRGLNDFGEVVGYSNTVVPGSPPTAFYYDGTTMFDLCKLAGCVAAGWDKFLAAYDINNLGDIVGIGSKEGKTRTFLARRVGPIADGDVNGDGEVNLGDLVLMLAIVSGRYNPTVEEQARGNVSPTTGGSPQTNTIIDSGDIVVLTQKILGL